MWGVDLCVDRGHLRVQYLKYQIVKKMKPTTIQMHIYFYFLYLNLNCQNILNKLYSRCLGFNFDGVQFC